MKRADKYPDTKYFHRYNANPKQKNTGDCVIRALSTAMEKPYIEVLHDLHVLQLKYFYDIGDQKLYGKYLERNGWKKQKQPRHENNTKYTGKQWCEFIQFWKNKNYNKIVAHIGTGHITAIVNGKIIDSWDCSDGCIGNYWIKEA